MLGVSQAATVGLHFQSDWTDANAPGYTGFQVTATAFGIPPSGWQNLTPLPTGYNKQGLDPGPFTLSETIGTTTNAPGLNPLPNGSLSVTWSAVAANASGFGYSGNHPPIGNDEVIYGFLRDNNFIYTSPTNPIGYSVLISGLQSVFTNSQYVIQLVASTDSGNVFTNAIITAGSNNQPLISLTYAVSQASFGPLAGVSSVSPPLDADSITIAGAPASGSSTTFGIASTISGIMITDEPVIQTQPQTPAAPFVDGNSVSLSVVAIGVPPLSYQWRRNGQPIPGATTTNYAIASVGLTNAGYYDVVVGNQYGSLVSAAAAVTGDILIRAKNNVLADTKPGGSGTEHDARNHGATWQASTTDSNGVTRAGVLFLTSDDPDRIDLPGETDFNTTNGTISFWMKSPGAETNFAHEGAMLIEWVGGGTGLQLDEDDTGVLNFNFKGTNGAGNSFQSTDFVADGNWHHIAFTYDQSGTGLVFLYVDGDLDGSTPSPNDNAWSFPSGQTIHLGQSEDGYWQPYDGSLADFRIYGRILTADEVGSIFTNSALVDTTNLQVRLNFGSPPATSLALDWLNGGSLVSANVVNATYTNVVSATSSWPFFPNAGQKYFQTYLSTAPVAEASLPAGSSPTRQAVSAGSQ